MHEGLASLHGDGLKSLDLAENREQKSLSFNLDDDLESWLREQLPRELRPENERLELIGDPKVMLARIKKSQAEELAWPNADYLWANHPVFTWLQDRLKAKQGRLQAPVLHVDDRGFDVAFLVSTTHPNRRGRPVYQRLWAACRSGNSWTLCDGEEWLARLDLAAKPLVNDGAERDLSPYSAMLHEAIALVEKSGRPDFKAFRERQKADMAKRLAEMEAVRQRRDSQLILSFSENNQPEQIKKARFQEEQERIRKTFEDWKTWVEDSMTLEDKPYLQLLVVFARKGRR